MKVKESESEVSQSCPTLCDPVDWSPPGSSVHGILQARILEWVAISFSGGSSRPRDRSQVSRIAGRCFNLWATREALKWITTWKNMCIYVGQRINRTQGTLEYIFFLAIYSQTKEKRNCKWILNLAWFFAIVGGFFW